jgi:pimeloyl-ACP methyl ester carboxylesterase
LVIDYRTLPNIQSFTARDGKPLDYRYYPSTSNKILVLLHGSGWHSQYFPPLANFISSEGLAQVYTPDLRGHGRLPERRGDVDYIGQLEDDLADFIALVRKENPSGKLILGGHSSGGGLAVRFAGSRYGRQADAYLLLAPFLQYNAPTIRPNLGGWALPNVGRIIGLILLNNLGTRWFNGLKVIEFNLPKEFRNGTETLAYSYRLNTSLSPTDYQKDLRVITQPLLVAVGSEDEVFYPDPFKPAVSQCPKATVKVLPGVSHLGIAVGPDIRPVVKEWMEGLG